MQMNTTGLVKKAHIVTSGVSFAEGASFWVVCRARCIQPTSA